MNWPVVAMFMVCVAFPLRADTFTFQDLTDIVTISTTSTRFVSSCLGETECNLVLSEPSPGAAATITISGFPLFISEPDELTLSDLVDAQICGPTIPGCDSAAIIAGLPAIQFSSDDDPSTFPCNLFFPCIPEDGTVQPAGTITWADGTIDTINFQSDVEAVPEPSTFMLLGAGLLGFGVVMHGRRFSWSARKPAGRQPGSDRVTSDYLQVG